MTETEKIIFETHKMVGDIKKDLAVSVTHQKQLRKEVDLHKAELDMLKETHQQNIGKKSVIYTLFAMVGGGIATVVNHFWK